MLCVVQGSVVEQRADAIVNAANHTLLGGGGRGRCHPPRRRAGPS
jgi:O-acetyl-ADP-ribose deacetylase (regulator of RNase III)